MSAVDQRREALGAAPELQITTYRDDGTTRRWTPIWVVLVDGELYVRSAYGGAGGWYRRATTRGTARVRAGAVETDVTLEPVADEATRAAVGAAYEQKYAGSGSALATMLEPPAAGTTTRLVTS
ncbi:DUF2255 family protein [Actinomycetospora endophytica]|uniref:DUF2255 family protein n=1 Tax=Actinomycetospora endophytica TaxID=2291215 RepID=A0ABS8PHC3_9PSEU|nr:DUF2255 family protein [Actinomycetospora endophytica]MCD2197672.1 DUF2255 family protein [Actinomycetospora endophytica]